MTLEKIAGLGGNVPDRSTASSAPKSLQEFQRLAALEPSLGKLFDEARSHDSDGDPRFCANAAWYGYNGHDGLKPRLLRLVGFERAEGRHPVLSTPEAYDEAYDAIYGALPDCRECGGCWDRGPATRGTDERRDGR